MRISRRMIKGVSICGAFSILFLVLEGAGIINLPVLIIPILLGILIFNVLGTYILAVDDSNWQ